MEGIITETIRSSPLRKEQRSNSIERWRYTSLNPVKELTFKAGDVLLPTSITSFRSGPSYERALNNGAIPSGSNIGERLASLAGDTGHEFTLTKPMNFFTVSESMYESACAGLNILKGRGGIAEVFANTLPVGTVLRNYSDYSFGSSDASLNALGTRFISETNPLKSEADLIVGIAEILREGLPSALFSSIVGAGPGRSAKIRALGSEYLNYVFGITPVVNDLKRMFTTLQRIDDIIDQWVRDDGSRVRRRRRIPRSTINTPLDEDVDASNGVGSRWLIPNSSVGYQQQSAYGNPSGSWRFVRSGSVQVVEDISFSSAWEYNLSTIFGSQFDSSNASSRFDATLRALGLNDKASTAETLWNLTPFSWLVDWFVNVGDMIAALRVYQTSGLSLTYGYMTSYAIRRGSYRWQLYNGASLRARGEVFYEQKRIRRRRATPFGFNVSFAGLSSSQLAILAALAATKL